MFIPAGAVVIGNAWAILHDPELFPDPESFNPSHFILTEKGGTYGCEMIWIPDGVRVDNEECEVKTDS